MNDNIIVLGGSGFLGKNIIKYLSKAGHRNITCGSLTKSKFPKVKCVKVNILNHSSLEGVCKPYNIIVNSTGQVTNPINTCYQLNTKGISNIVKVAKKYNSKVIHISTVSVYGTTKSASERSTINPETPYAACKGFAEYLLNNSLPENGKIIIRPSNLYGVGTKGLFNNLHKSYISDRKLFFNSEKLLRYFLHVEDCAENIVKLLTKKRVEGTYNLIGNEKYTIKNLIKILENETGVKFEVKYENVTPPENIDNISDKKIKKEINVTYKHNVRAYFRQQFRYNR